MSKDIKLSIDTIETLLAEMKRAQAQEPKASIVFDVEALQIEIRYKLPEDWPKKNV